MDKIVIGCLNVTWIHSPASLLLPSRQDDVVSLSIASRGGQRPPSVEDAVASLGCSTMPGPGAIGPGDGLAVANRPPRINAAPTNPRTPATRSTGSRIASQRQDRGLGSSTSGRAVSTVNSGLPHDRQKRRVVSFSVPQALQMTPVGAGPPSSSGGLTISISLR